ncbi:MAG: tRNA pseudouridine(38-40) synthase TruA [Bacilli bacterium]|nr:tRNA pseudouridine(38-40) synthase TruA [Bacilli bacterium]
MRYKCTVSYDGTNFHGFQIQDDLRTVQKEIEDVLLIINKCKTIIYPSGRTDTGVHAYGQVFHFDSDIIMGCWNMQNAINSRLPKDIYLTKVEKVDDSFHARFNAVKKEYHYMIDFGEFNPLYRNYRYYCHFRNIDRQLLEEVAKSFVGKHDFRSFTKNKKLLNTTREIYSIDFFWDKDLLTIKIIGSGFMHNMVRILVAMWLEVGRGKYSKEQLKVITEEKNRVFAPKIAPASGLYLYKVYY